MNSKKQTNTNKTLTKRNKKNMMKEEHKAAPEGQGIPCRAPALRNLTGQCQPGQLRRDDGEVVAVTPARRDLQVVRREHVVPERRLVRPLDVPQQHVAGHEHVGHDPQRAVVLEGPGTPDRRWPPASEPRRVPGGGRRRRRAVPQCLRGGAAHRSNGTPRMWKQTEFFVAGSSSRLQDSEVMCPSTRAQRCRLALTPSSGLDIQTSPPAATARHRA